MHVPFRCARLGRRTTNIVLPGRVATLRIAFLDEQKAKREGKPVEQVAAESTASILMGRHGLPEEYGSVVAFLASQPAGGLCHRLSGKSRWRPDRQRLIFDPGTSKATFKNGIPWLLGPSRPIQQVKTARLWRTLPRQRSFILTRWRTCWISWTPVIPASKAMLGSAWQWQAYAFLTPQSALRSIADAAL